MHRFLREIRLVGYDSPGALTLQHSHRHRSLLLNNLTRKRLLPLLMPNLTLDIVLRHPLDKHPYCPQHRRHRYLSARSDHWAKHLQRLASHHCRHRYLPSALSSNHWLSAQHSKRQAIHLNRYLRMLLDHLEMHLLRRQNHHHRCRMRIDSQRLL